MLQFIMLSDDSLVLAGKTLAVISSSDTKTYTHCSVVKILNLTLGQRETEPKFLFVFLFIIKRVFASRRFYDSLLYLDVEYIFFAPSFLWTRQSRLCWNIARFPCLIVCLKVLGGLTFRNAEESVEK